MKTLLETQNDFALTLARIALGAMILPHGAQKMLGWFGGGGLAATVQGMSSSGIPVPLVYLAIFAEFFGGLGLLTGTLTRLSAFGVAIVMMVAVLKIHLANGFFMNWMGAQKGEGVEFFILALGLALIVLIRGGGAMSVDRAVEGKLAVAV